MNAIRLLLLAFVPNLVWSSPEADIPQVIYFQNGDTLSGRIMDMTPDHLLVQSEWGQKLTLPLSHLSGWTQADAGFGFQWALDTKTFDSVSQRKVGAEERLEWREDSNLYLHSPQYMTFLKRLPTGLRFPLEMEFDLSFPEGKPGLTWFVVPDSGQKPFSTPGVMIRIHKGTLTCISYLSDQHVDARYRKASLSIPETDRIRIRLFLDPVQNQFSLHLNEDLFLKWREPENVIRKGLSFERVDWKFTGNAPVLIHGLSIRAAGGGPTGEALRPPMLELSNGESLACERITWNADSLEARLTGRTQTLSIPSERVPSVILQPRNTPVKPVPEQEVFLITGPRKVSRLTMKRGQPSETNTPYNHAFIREPLLIPPR